MTRYWDHMGNPTAEPPCIGPEVIVAFLEQQGRPRFAAFVKRLAEDCQTANMREARLRDRINELVMKYEPPPARSDGPVWTGD
jgi:hypothetical protein